VENVSQRNPGFADVLSVEDIIPGLVTAVVMIATSISYATLIFSGPLLGSLPIGIGYALTGAAIVSAIFAVGSAIPFAIAGPDSKPVAVLSAMAAIMAADLIARGQVDAVRPTVVAGLVIGTLITGLVLYLLGRLNTGRWIRFIPYPVIGGFLAASGWLLVTGSIRVLTGVSLDWQSFGGLVDGAQPWHLAAGIGFAIAIVLVRRTGHFLGFPILLVVGTAIVHLVLWQTGYSIAEARADGWLIDPGAGVSLPAFRSDFPEVQWTELLRSSGEFVALIAVTAITLLLSTTAVEVEARLDLDLDRELRVNGIANLLAGLTGGMVGTLSVSRTMFNYVNGARRRASGLIAALVCVLTFAFGTQALGYLPVPILGAMLLNMGGGLLNDWIVKGWSRMQRADYLQVVVILLVIARWDFVAGIAVGIVSACVTFAINSSRVRLVKLVLSRSDYGSRVDRPRDQDDELMRHGNGIQIMWLHGFVFFGSANRLLLRIKDIVAAQGHGVCRVVLLDFRQVLGIDSTAVLSLIKLRHFAEGEGLTIVLSGLPAAVELSLRSDGFIAPEHEATVRVFPDLDAALEWCEDKLLAECQSREEALRSADEWLAGEIGSQEMFNRLVSYLEMVEYQPGDVMFAQGETADCLFLLYSGRVSVLFAAPDRPPLRLRSMIRHTVVGEMGLYRTMPRGATLRVDQPAVAYRLSREALEQMEADDPLLAHAFHKFVIRTVAARLDFANREVAGLQH
jgi:SulP family sulfate permease